MALIKDTKVRHKLFDNNTASEAESDTLAVHNWLHHSIHVNTGGQAITVSIEVSLEDPDGNDVVQSWVVKETVNNTDAFIQFTGAIRWLRVKRDTTTDPLTVIYQGAQRAIT